MRSINTNRTPRKDGSIPLQVTVRIPGHPGSVSATCATLEGCEEFRVKAERQLRLQAPTVRTRAHAVTKEEMDNESLADTFKRFLKSKYVKERNRKHAPAILKNIGSVKRKGITVRWVEDYIEDMRSKMTNRHTPYSWDTIAIQLGLINKVLKWRADDLQHPHVRVPFRIGDMFPKNWKNKRKRRFEKGEEDMLMREFESIRTLHSRPFWRLFTQFTLETAARLQEVVNASWENVTWETRTWFIPEGKTPERHVPLSKRAVSLLRELEELRHPQSQRIFHELGNPASVSALFSRYAKRAGLVDYREHDLRHEGISRLVIHKRKMSLRQIGLMVGHSSEHMTEYYTHMRGDEVADLLD